MNNSINFNETKLPNSHVVFLQKEIKDNNGDSYSKYVPFLLDTKPEDILLKGISSFKMKEVSSTGFGEVITIKKKGLLRSSNAFSIQEDSVGLSDYVFFNVSAKDYTGKVSPYTMGNNGFSKTRKDSKEKELSVSEYLEEAQEKTISSKEREKSNNTARKHFNDGPSM